MSQFALRVYYEDTDAAGVVYYANYLKFCERARTEWLRNYGFSQHSLASESGILFVVSRFVANYLKPAQLDDELVVHSTIMEPRRASLVFVQQITRGDDTLFSAEATIACLDAQSRRPARLPSALIDCVNRETQVFHSNFN